MSLSVWRFVESISGRLATLSRFSFVGVVATVVYVVVANGLIAASLMSAAWASVVAYLAGMIFSFLGQSQFTFRSGTVTSGQIVRYAVLSGGGMTLSYAVIVVLRHGAGVTGPPATVIAAAIIALFSFFVMRAWVFKPSSHK